MKVVFLPSSSKSVRWFSRDYRSVFPEGRGKARARMRRALELISDNPQIGHVVEDAEQREFSIPKTPFPLIYRIAGEQIEILRVWDGRANPGRLTAPDEGLD
ncbi:type II toxin-antitoxin system RelE/ParE family toxin [Oryzicola mucosus]|nr:type II toxin-antitoxin system RelE/ParE family toxin [Oryzicola mucosus]